MLQGIYISKLEIANVKSKLPIGHVYRKVAVIESNHYLVKSTVRVANGLQRMGGGNEEV